MSAGAASEPQNTISCKTIDVTLIAMYIGHIDEAINDVDVRYALSQGDCWRYPCRRNHGLMIGRL